MKMMYVSDWFIFFFFKQKTAYEMRISDWSSDVCSSDLAVDRAAAGSVGRCAPRPPPRDPSAHPSCAATDRGSPPSACPASPLSATTPDSRVWSLVHTAG